jgi:hypothetical protein
LLFGVYAHLVWQPHYLQAITNVTLVRDNVRHPDFCNTLGYHVEMIGDAGAKPYYGRALAIRKKVLEGHGHKINHACLLAHATDGRTNV